jgi:hypothetical protein
LDKLEGAKEIQEPVEDGSKALEGKVVQGGQKEGNNLNGGLSLHEYTIY